MKKLLSLLLPSLFLIVSCSSEDEAGTDLSSEEASTEIHSIMSDASGDITALVESAGVNGVLDFFDLIEGYDFGARVNEPEDVRGKIQLLGQYLVFGPANKVGEDDIISFEEIKGLYEWNPSTQTFDESSSEFFIVRFPTEDSETNNAELKISALELVTLQDDEGLYQLPTLTEAYLKLDENEVINLSLVAEWRSDGFPVQANVFLLVDPFTFTLGFNDSFESTTSLATSIKLDDVTITAIDVDVAFQSQAKEEVVGVEGFVQYYNLKVSGNVNTALNEESDDINDYIDLEILLEDQKIGDIVFDEDLAYIEYEDGTRELLEEVLEPIILEIESLLEEL